MEHRESLTVRFPAGLLSEAKGVKDEHESLNDLVIDAVRQEVRRRQGLRAFEEIARLHDQIKEETSLQPDSVPLIRELREGIGRRD